MPRYALVELSTMAVVNVATVSSVPPAPTGFRNIVENLTTSALNEWKADNPPAVGLIWDGQIPAGFTAPAPAPDVPLDIEQAKVVVNDAITKLQNVLAGLENIQGG